MAKAKTNLLSRLQQDLVGQRFGRLVVKARGGLHPKRQARLWHCICDCGNHHYVVTHLLKSGGVQSCGCINEDRMRVNQYALKHGCCTKDKLREYGIWANMLRRCLDETNLGYHNYGGRGIKVCNRWASSFNNFFADMGKRPSAKHSLDRIDNDGPYSPENCRWATGAEQANNTRANRRITFKGETLTLAQWAKRAGISGTLLHFRLKQGWPFDQALSPPRHTRKLAFRGEAHSVTEWAAILGLSTTTINNRLRAGLPVEQALFVGNAGHRLITFRGTTLTLSGWAERLGLSLHALSFRLERWPLSKALTGQTNAPKVLAFRGQTSTVKQWSEELGIPAHLIYQRLSLGWSVARALGTPPRPDSRRSRPQSPLPC